MEAIYFVIASFLAFYIPGSIFLRKFKLTFIINISSSIILGMSIWAIQGFLLGYLNLRFLSYIYLIAAAVIWAKINYPLLKNTRRINIYPNLTKEDFILCSVFVIGVGLQILTVIANAIPVDNGLYFCCGGVDAIYHAALVKELITNFPPNEPGIANTALHNYHFLSNLIVSELVRVFRLPLFLTEFQFVPILMSILFGLTLFNFASVLKIGKSFVILFLILGFFFSDIFYVLTLATKHKLLFNLGTIETSQSLWISYTRYFGVVFFMQASTFLLIWIKDKEKTIKKFLPLLLTGGILIGLKVYLGFLFLFGIGILSIYYLIRKEFKIFVLILIVFLFSALLYLPVNNSSGGLIFTGFWKTRDLIANPSTNLVHLELARKIFEDGGNLKRYIFDLLFLSIYIIFSLGILILGILNSPKTLKKIPLPIHIYFISGLVITFILGMFFIQKTGGANSGQFLISLYIVGIFYTALFLNSLWIKNTKLLKILVIIFILIMIPKTINISLLNINKFHDHKGIVLDESLLQSFNYINKNVPPDSIFMVDSSLGDACLYLPLFTDSKSYFCASAAPADRGIDVNKLKISQDENNFNYFITHTQENYPRGKTIIYKNKSVMIIKNN